MCDCEVSHLPECSLEARRVKLCCSIQLRNAADVSNKIKRFDQFLVFLARKKQYRTIVYSHAGR
ncbi:RNA chaperone Hfq [Vibrio mimicus]